MGSSTASETTINTSTDSSNTIVTTMTATDGDVTEDSLDITEPVDFFYSENILDGNKIQPLGSQILQPVPASPKTPATAKQKTPPTAIAVKQETKFTFDIDSPSLSKNQTTSSKFPLYESGQNEINCIAEEKSVEKLMEEQIEALKLDAKRRNSYKVVSAQSDEIVSDKRRMSCPKEHRRSTRRKLDVNKEKLDRVSPKRHAERPPSNSSPDTNDTDSPKPKHRHKKSSRRHHSPAKQREQFTYDEKHIAKYREKARMTPPDLRVDFFNESVDRCQKDPRQHVVVSHEKRGSVCLNKCLREVGAQLEASATSPINVTTNPLENSVHFGGRKATIVVQQPSVSLDHSNVSTILLKNGSEFVSNVESTGSKLSLKRQKEENMKQLLDVANNLTLEEIHDIEMR